MHRFRFSNTWHLYPAHCQVPVASQLDLSIVVAADLLKVFGGTVPIMTSKKIKHIQAIQKLTAIMAGHRTTPPTVDASTKRVDACPRVVTTPPPRVDTTSNNITTTNAIRQMPLVHLRLMQNNNPFHILSNNYNDDDTVVASNCSPSPPLTILPSSVPPVSPPTRQAPR